jgi:hypothetical protein
MKPDRQPGLVNGREVFCISEDLLNHFTSLQGLLTEVVHV